MNDLFENDISLFPTTYNEITQRIRSVKPVKYGKTRNFVDGSVTYLSPYISRGVISTQQILSELLTQGYQPQNIEKFIQELAWRDYWQQVWIAKGEAINTDLKNEQYPISNTQIPKAVVDANTGIKALDTAIAHFYKTGYLHNHVRMYIASIVCNMAQSHWKRPAQWMYYNLLDADWASNALSWQWVAGANSNKKYYANQDNINKYCHTKQTATFLDVSYEAFGSLPIPNILQECTSIHLETPLPTTTTITIDESLPTLVYNFYNLDPLWKKEVVANRVLLLEPSHFKDYPISQKTLDFILALSDNIEGIQLYVGAFDDFIRSYAFGAIYYKEHPLNNHYKGNEEPRDWMFSFKGYYPSFFAFWKKCKKELPY
ncbi:FAD-binding domain-containing protein [Croceitalea rosinachiae]|uniref:FAD-binding domain-containing protein n=1 Tax=Croceitalea rosinachiae TaxID=3075596 RepID=A0ABU3A804_9FLAO|nr:FAD-binding domain-containing protein [Croceitalea sp. F388]MDT0606310.1 FAD-binding domain-containing protein [Croceitalea sp. F388]